MELASRWGEEGSKGSGLPWWKLAFQMFQAAILVNWGYVDPPDGGAVVVHILILMFRDIVEHGHLVPSGWGAEFCNWACAPRERQCSSLNTGLIWSNLCLVYIILAALFGQHWSGIVLLHIIGCYNNSSEVLRWQFFLLLVYRHIALFFQLNIDWN